MVGTAISSPGTTTRAGQGESANPVVVTKWVQPPSALVSGPLVLSSMDKSRSLSGKPATTDTHILLPVPLERKRERDAENTGTLMGRTARSHQDGASRGCSELSSRLFADQSKSQTLYEELGASAQALSQLSGDQSRSPETHRHLPVQQCQRHHLAALQTQKLLFPLALWDLDAFKMQNVLLPSKEGGGRNT